MKSLILIVTFFFCTLIITSCIKEKNNPSGGSATTGQTDYRDKYVGNYFSRKLCTFWTLNQQQIDTVFNDTLTVSVIKNPSISTQLIINGDVIEIDTSGSYTGYYNPAAYKNYAVSFYNDSVSIRTFSGGLGGGTSCYTDGVK